MNNKHNFFNDIINENGRNCIMAPVIPPPPISSVPSLTSIPYNPTPSINCFKHENDKYIIDNNTLYTKLIDLESEIKSLKSIISNFKSLKSIISNINYPKPTYNPTQPFNYTTNSFK